LGYNRPVIPPTRVSRHRFCFGVQDTHGRSFLTERTPFGYRGFADDQQHLVQDGDTLWGLAELYYAGVDRPAGLWWVIADYQPEPIFDPTIMLAPGTLVVVPSMRALQQEILNEARRRVDPLVEL
jgi:hypothetical protein